MRITTKFDEIFTKDFQINVHQVMGCFRWKAKIDGGDVIINSKKKFFKLFQKTTHADCQFVLGLLWMHGRDPHFFLKDSFYE